MTPPPGPDTTSWFHRLWFRVQPLLIRESIVIVQSVIKGGELVLSRLETRSSQLQLPAPTPESSYLLKSQPLFQSLGQKWWQAMGWLRGKLPGAWASKLTETTLTAIFIGILFIFLWPGPSKTPVTPPPPKSRTTPITAPKNPPAETTVLVKPRLAPESQPAPLEIPVTPEVPEPIATTPIEADLPEDIAVTPEPFVIAEPELLDIEQESDFTEVSPEPNPVITASDQTPDEPDIPELTPEEAWLADTRQQLLSIPERYHPGLVESLNLQKDPATLKFVFTQAWYDLKPQQQDGLVNDLWQQRQLLDLNNFEITDPSGQLLVRPPVIGSQPVIVHRVATVP